MTTHNFYDFSDIRYGQDAGRKGRWKPPREPQEVPDPPLSVGAENICVQASAAWFPKAIGFIGDWFNPNTQINETEWIYPPGNDTSLPPLANQLEAASEDCLFLDVKVPFNIWKKKGSQGFMPDK